MPWQPPTRPWLRVAGTGNSREQGTAPIVTETAVPVRVITGPLLTDGWTPRDLRFPKVGVFYMLLL